MANEIRLRANNIAGSITDNPLTAGSTTINSPGFVDLPTVDTTNHLILILDPLEANGAAEIVRVTAHGAASSVVTVVRGAENSTPRQHPLGSTWFHGPVTSDTVEVLTSSTRPTIPYEGQMIYETDTNKLVGFGGVDWAPRDAGGTLGYVQTTSDQNTITDADMTGLSTAVTVGTGRRIRISWFDPRWIGTAAADQFAFRLQEGGTVLAAATLIVVAGNQGTLSSNVSVILTPSAGSHTYKAHTIRISGTGNISADRVTLASPAYLLVEDIGAA